MAMRLAHQVKTAEMVNAAIFTKVTPKRSQLSEACRVIDSLIPGVVTQTMLSIVATVAVQLVCRNLITVGMRQHSPGSCQTFKLRNKGSFDLQVVRLGSRMHLVSVLQVTVVVRNRGKVILKPVCGSLTTFWFEKEMSAPLLVRLSVWYPACSSLHVVLKYVIMRNDSAIWFYTSQKVNFPRVSACHLLAHLRLPHCLITVHFEIILHAGRSWHFVSIRRS